MTKNHEILDEYMQGEPELTDGQYHHAKLAMDEYAKQESIGFAEWIAKNNYTCFQQGWTNVKKFKPDWQTTEQIYTIYQNQKGK